MCGRIKDVQLLHLDVHRITNASAHISLAVVTLGPCLARYHNTAGSDDASLNGLGGFVSIADMAAMPYFQDMAAMPYMAETWLPCHTWLRHGCHAIHG